VKPGILSPEVARALSDLQEAREHAPHHRDGGGPAARLTAGGGHRKKTRVTATKIGIRMAAL